MTTKKLISYIAILAGSVIAISAVIVGFFEFYVIPKKYEEFERQGRVVYIQKVDPYYKGDFYHDEADAFCHAYAAGMITLEYGYVMATIYIHLYERKN